MTIITAIRYPNLRNPGLRYSFIFARCGFRFSKCFFVASSSSFHVKVFWRYEKTSSAVHIFKQGTSGTCISPSVFLDAKKTQFYPSVMSVIPKALECTGGFRSMPKWLIRIIHLTHTYLSNWAQLLTAKWHDTIQTWFKLSLHHLCFLGGKMKETTHIAMFKSSTQTWKIHGSSFDGFQWEETCCKTTNTTNKSISISYPW